MNEIPSFSRQFESRQAIKPSIDIELNDPAKYEKVEFTKKPLRDIKKEVINTMEQLNAFIGVFSKDEALLKKKGNFLGQQIINSSVDTLVKIDYASRDKPTRSLFDDLLDTYYANFLDRMHDLYKDDSEKNIKLTKIGILTEFASIRYFQKLGIETYNPKREEDLNKEIGRAHV